MAALHFEHGVLVFFFRKKHNTESSQLHRSVYNEISLAIRATKQRSPC